MSSRPGISLSFSFSSSLDSVFHCVNFVSILCIPIAPWLILYYISCLRISSDWTMKSDILILESVISTILGDPISNFIPTLKWSHPKPNELRVQERDSPSKIMVFCFVFLKERKTEKTLAKAIDIYLEWVYSTVSNNRTYTWNMDFLFTTRCFWFNKKWENLSFSWTKELFYAY